MDDFRKPTDTVVIVRYWGKNLSGAEILQADGSWKRHGRPAARKFVRPDGERWISQHEADLRHRTISLWIA